MTFKVYKVESISETEELIDRFSREDENVRQFYISRSDNRSARMLIQNKRRDGFDNVVIVFQNAHKLH